MINLCHFPITAAGVTYPAAVSAPLVFSPRTVPGSHPAFPVLVGFDAPPSLTGPAFGTLGPSAGMFDAPHPSGVPARMPDGTPNPAFDRAAFQAREWIQASAHRANAEWICGVRDVIVPRFAAAVGWAIEAGLTPYCVPLSGQRQPDGSFVCEALEPAPEGLEVDFLAPKGGVYRVRGMAVGHLPTYPVECPDIPLGDYLIQRATPGSFVVQVLDGPNLAPVPVEEQAVRLPDGSVQVPPLASSYVDAILVPQDGRIIDAVHAAYPDVAILVTGVTRKGERPQLFQVR